MKLHRFMPYLVAFFLALSAMNAMAESVQKLGFIDTERVYRQSTQAQQIQRTLQQEFSARQQAIARLRQEGEALQAKLGSGQLSAAQSQQTRNQLVALDDRLRREAAQLAEEYNLRRNEEFAALQQNANRVIENLAEKEGYDLIISDAIYVNRKFDITDEVIRALNQSH